jgi:hypothetical protein
MTAPVLVEEWRSIAGYTRYEVSNTGLIRSRKSYGYKILYQGLGVRGYPQVILWRDGRGRTHSVHALVATTFFGPRPQGLQVRHLDGDKFHNQVENLAYGTPSENQYDRVRHGRNWEANKTHCVRGHPFDEANTYITTRGHRRCRTCLQASRLPRDLRRSAEAAARKTNRRSK